MLQLLGLGHRERNQPNQLSGGQQQRVAIARALANDPSIILADEPTGNLDSETSDAVLRLFRELARAGTTVVIATHEREISGVVDRKIELADGSITADSTSARTVQPGDRS